MLSQDILTTKLYIPPTRPELVSRPRLMERLNAGLHRKLALVSAPAGFGKTTVLSEWVDPSHSNAVAAVKPGTNVAWLSLDEGDNDPAVFLSYLVAAIQMVEADIVAGEIGSLLASQSPAIEAVLTLLINELVKLSSKIILILDDYHLIESQLIHESLSFLLENIPQQMQLVIASREDPDLPLAGLRAKDQLTEIRAADLRFTPIEAAKFMNEVMGLNLAKENIAALEKRTEGWIAGLQMAALSMQGRENSSELIESFTGSHRFVLDYLIEEVLEQQPERIQAFLMKTSILDHLTGPLCDAVTGQEDGQQTLENLDHANLFIVSLDNERRRYRYHHLFADLLQQRLHQSSASKTGHVGERVADLHIRASEWYEENGQAIKAFRHAVAANDVERATRLIEGGGMPLTFRGALNPVLNWLGSLPITVLDSHPLLWVTYASAALGSGQATGVEEKLQAAEAALESAKPDDNSRDIIGRIAATRATLAWGQGHAETIIDQSRRALEYLHPDNLPFRTSTNWKLASAYELQGDWAAAKQAYFETIATCEASGNTFINILASTGLGDLQVSDTQLHQAAETFQRIIDMVGDRPPAAACGAYLGLAQISYEWNDLETAQNYGQLSAQLSRSIESTDAFAQCALFTARLRLTRGDVARAVADINEAEQFVRQHNFMRRMADVAAMQVLALLHQGDLAAAADLADKYELPRSQARVYLARRDPSGALAILKPWRQQLEAKGLADERLKVMVLQAMALYAHGKSDQAAAQLVKALTRAEPAGFIRTFVDEGSSMEALLRTISVEGSDLNEYVRTILAAFSDQDPQAASVQPLIEPLSERELEVLQLIAEGLTNQEIASRLYLTLNTVKVHTRNIYGKLGTKNRTQAAAKARELGLLPSS